MTHPCTLAVYIHWPFCLSKCPYCDFNSHVREEVDIAAWKNAYARQLSAYAERTGPRRVTSVFFGGGTPSLMPPVLVEAIIETVIACWDIDAGVEITLGATPAVVDRQRFEGFAAAGVNRVSIGVQSFDNAALAFLERGHSGEDARRAVELASRLFGRFSFDLIYALPEQTVATWRHQMDNALVLADGHLSLYQLTIEPGTAFHSAWRRGKLMVPDEDAAGALFETTQEVMEAGGLPAYEISNHARPGDESRHNLTYWRYGDYIGIGPGAHGRFQINEIRHGTRHHHMPEVWLDQALNGVSPMAPEQGSSIIGDAEARLEAVMMGLRTVEGVSLAMTGVPGEPESPMDAEVVMDLTGKGLLTCDSERLRATATGRQRLNAILAAILR
ncbi:MAG: radical SAM family heme chaperone HemW [Rhodospirillaceae bacterium]|nr:radical SAM family heme chaperone HemW [Rhodospirillaceae bacterium]